jgi:hypothetical protein
MGAPGMMRAVMAGLLLAPTLVIANGTEPAAPDVRSLPALTAPAAPQAATPQVPLWPQMVPVVGPQGVYWMPAPGMGWPVAPRYPSPTALPYPGYPVWSPFVWVLVPIAALTPGSAPASAEVDYGPVAETPVVELPLLGETPEPTSAPLPPPAPTPAVSEAATLTSDMRDPAKPVDDSAAAAPARELPVSAGTERSSPTADEPTAAVPMSQTAVDYGPVTPTPVVDLLALEKPAAAPRPKKPRAAPKPLQPASNAPATAAPAPPPLPTPAPPARKRLCWNKGVVAPCR